MTEEITVLETTNAFTLNEVFSITSIDAHGEAYACDVSVTDREGETYTAIHIYRASDPHGLSPILKQWVLDHRDFPIANYVEPTQPTAEEIRAAMRPITPRQLRLALVRSGISLLTVVAAIDALPEGSEKEEAEIEWEYATIFNRTAPALLSIAGALGLSPEAVDTLWASALLI
jgi:hypothetical protein